jgi:hypothetical protein
MKALIKKVIIDFPDEPESFERTIVFNLGSRQDYYAFHYGREFEAGKTFDVVLEFLDADPQNGAMEAFSGNSECVKRLVHKSNWSYDGYGQIISINPTIVDFGEISLKVGLQELTKEDIGRYIYWAIDRLDIDTDVSESK